MLFPAECRALVAGRHLHDTPLHRGESVDIAPEDAERLGISDGEVVEISSRRGTVHAPARVDFALKPGLVFMTLHFPDQVPTNFLTIDEFDPLSGTAEFKACAVRVVKVAPGYQRSTLSREQHAESPELVPGD